MWIDYLISCIAQWCTDTFFCVKGMIFFLFQRLFSFSEYVPPNGFSITRLNGMIRLLVLKIFYKDAMVITFSSESVPL